MLPCLRCSRQHPQLDRLMGIIKPVLLPPPQPPISRAFQVSKPVGENGLTVITDSFRVCVCVCVWGQWDGYEATELGGWDQGPAQSALQWGSNLSPRGTRPRRLVTSTCPSPTSVSFLIEIMKPSRTGEFLRTVREFFIFG